eukprot:evm.model.scf_436.4 EVM.evm.TU.scf_436.4   scf_436:53900-54452(-)
METEPLKDPEKGEAAGAGTEWNWSLCGYEWKSKASILGVPLVHVAFGANKETGRMNVAHGVVSIGSVAVGIVTIAQVGIGVFTLAQIGLGVAVMAQIGLGVAVMAPFGVAIAAAGHFVAGVWTVTD